MIRLRDVILALFLLLLVSPVLFLSVLLVRWQLGSPVLFVQQRPGKYGKPFQMYKFRSMTSECDKFGNLLPDEQRVTRFGRLLRSSSIDELPALINVLKGELSLVGPRPLLMDYLPLYSKEQTRRHEVLPGITGWAQVNGRNSVSWEQKFALDIWYVDNRSFWLDCVILLRTITKVLKRSDIVAEGSVTAERFTGNAK